VETGKSLPTLVRKETKRDDGRENSYLLSPTGEKDSNAVTAVERGQLDKYEKSS